MQGSLAVGGEFIVERWSPDETRLLDRRHAKNGFTLLGLNHVLEVLCRQQSQSTWKVGLIDNAAFDELLEADTIASHAGWTEITAYDEAARPLWAPGVTASKRIINPSAVRFTMSDSKEINGIFLCSDNTKGGATGLLLCTGSFDTPMLMLEDEIAKVFYLCKSEGR